MIGDAGYLADDREPAKGVVFDGRIAEDFKLESGTWVHVGALRVAAIAACAPLVQDAVVTGHDREEVGLLAFASPAAETVEPARTTCGVTPSSGTPTVRRQMR
jgi:feruloyl-CoA synthase